MPFKWKWRFQSNYCLPDGELNPGLPRDRRGYWPLYYRGLFPVPGIEPEPPGWKPGILATRPCGMCRNPGPLDLQFNDLPTELFWHTLSTLSRSARLHAGPIFAYLTTHSTICTWLIGLVWFSLTVRETTGLTPELTHLSMNSLLSGDVAQMFERSLSMREVRGSMPCISNCLLAFRNECTKFVTYYYNIPAFSNLTFWIYGINFTR